MLVSAVQWSVSTVVHLPSRVRLSATPWTAARPASLSLTISQSLPKFMFILSVAIQLSHPLTSSSPSALNLSQYHRLFQWVVCSHQMIRILGLQCQHQSFQWIFRVDLPYDWLVWSPCYPRDFQESSPAPQFRGINSLAFCLLYGPAFATVRDHWENYTDLRWWSNVSAFQHTL